MPASPRPAAPDDHRTPSPGRWPWLASRLQVRHRFAALGVVGVLMCALPLLQVLRYQGAALDANRGAQAALDPLANAVAVQRGLVQHRDVARAVLRGAAQRESERRQRQAVVNERLTELDLSLRHSGHTRATAESEALRADWTVLSRRVEERSLAATDSDAAHRLLVEQTLQVIDYVSLAFGHLDGQAEPVATAWLQPVLHTLPRLSARLGLLTSAEAGSTEAHPREFAAAQRRLALVLAELQALPRVGDGKQGVESAALAFGQQAEQVFDLQRHSAPAARLQAAAQGLAEADTALFAQAHDQLRLALAAQGQALAGQRLTLLASLAVLAALGTALGLSLLPPATPAAGRRTQRPAPRRFKAADPATPDSLPPTGDASGTPPGRGEARRLLQRLRAPGSPPPQPSRDRPSTRFPHTLPPED